MPSVCFYFQMHQPLRLRRYSVFDSDAAYFDEFRNTEILKKVANNCYLPAGKILLDAINRLDGRFRVSFSITGVLIEQLRRQQPRVLDLLVKLGETGCVEFLGETYYHSLAFLYSRDEFREQVHKHAGLMEDLFGYTPRVFRNTELIYNNDLAHYVTTIDEYLGVLAEGADKTLDGRSPDHVYHPPHCGNVKLLLKNYRLSDDIAFRFSNRDWPGWPLTPAKFAACVDAIHGKGEVCNLFMDFETFGEHQWAQTGILEFLRDMPEAVLESGRNGFMTVSEAIRAYDAVDEFDAPHMISWADTERDLSAWLGNAMQSNAMHELYKLEGPVKASGDAALLEDWRRLTISDHVYYMCTKYFADGAVHSYFNPYESPYDAYINFMNVLDNLRSRAGL